MENSLEKMMLPYKTQQLLDMIIEKRSLNIKDAMPANELVFLEAIEVSE